MVGFGRPNKLVESLPSNGFTLLVTMNELSWAQIAEIEKLKSIVYLLHAGRNKVKLFVPDVTEIHQTYK